MTNRNGTSRPQSGDTYEQRSLMRLMTFLSPSFPTGSFAYSHGLEMAYAQGILKTPQDFENWIRSLITNGSAWCDSLFCAESWRCQGRVEGLQVLADQCEAMAGSKERHRELMAQGEAFLDAANAWLSASPVPSKKTFKSAPLPVALGAVAAQLSIPLEATLTAQYHAFISNQIQAALRMGRFGQQQGIRLLAEFEGDILHLAKRASLAGFSELGSCTYVADIMAIKHETMTTRIFIS